MISELLFIKGVTTERVAYPFGENKDRIWKFSAILNFPLIFAITV